MFGLTFINSVVSTERYYTNAAVQLMATVEANKCLPYIEYFWLMYSWFDTTPLEEKNNPFS